MADSDDSRETSEQADNLATSAAGAGADDTNDAGDPDGIRSLRRTKSPAAARPPTPHKH